MYSGKFSLWCDFVERDFLNGEFKEHIKNNVFNGATSNPSIFKNAILNSKAYNKNKKDFKGKSPKEIYESMAIEDIKNAATILLKNYKNGDDGFISLEVDPSLCNNANSTYEEGVRLFNAINMPNVMIKVPATKEGYEAMTKLIKKGINVNATLIFSPKQTKECLNAFKKGNEEFKKEFGKKRLPQAVISIFVSRLDKALDKAMVEHGFEAGKIGVLNATKCYNIIKEANLENVRALFASTGVKSNNLKPSYYVDELMYKNSINTAPLDTIKEFIKGKKESKTPKSSDEIELFFSKIKSFINIDEIYNSLLDDGLKQFEVAFKDILNMLGEKENQGKQEKNTNNIRQYDMNKTKLDKYLKFLVDHNGSDLHIKAGSIVRGRVNGDMIKLGDDVLSKEEVENVVKELLGDRFKELEEKKNLDFTYILNKEYRFRVNIFYQLRGISAVFRAILSKIPTIDELKLPSVLKTICDTTMRGLILVSGPTGTGKTTTMASMLNRINHARPAHIITIEDPVEYIYEDDKSLINQRAIGQDCTTFSDSLRAALREDPDIIFVGEMRDLETIETAIRAAETGHLVFSTIHTLDAKETINRIISMFDAEEQERMRLAISTVLEAVISQRLILTKEGNRRPVVEVLRKNERIKQMIIHNRMHEINDAIKDGRNTYGMQTFDQHLLDMFRDGIVTREEALDKSSNRGDLDIEIKQVILAKRNEERLKTGKVEKDDDEFDIPLEEID